MCVEFCVALPNFNQGVANVLSHGFICQYKKLFAKASRGGGVPQTAAGLEFVYKASATGGNSLVVLLLGRMGGVKLWGEITHSAHRPPSGDKNKVSLKIPTLGPSALLV